ncbi:uncharacterized protein LOC124369165 isoform X2 [Homalodisca vitripennis]|uniref:uncharacterized protein LOC124369165 isoform X2 n=1 Tax=Homalodisca vitripennis TaxID=197043 RepID=UPI001EEA3550|nr:uncharacterized protein LOC124369165 isoform X2 [Homalodisca vitripennis]
MCPPCRAYTEMWFCCQIWQCSVKSCFSPSVPFDMQWKGWTHVVYPSSSAETNSRSLTFLETRLVDDHVKTNIFLHRQKSSTHHSPPVTCFSKPNPEAVECEVAVEIHPGPNVNSSSSLKGGQPPLIRHASVSSLDPCHAVSKGNWERSEEVDGEGEQRVPWRASSTDWTKLETSLDFWRQEHSRAQQEDSSRLSKVRYNDTGSLEEVSVDNCVDYFVEDEIMVHLEADRENMRQQYRRLWQLRATLEEDEDSKKPSVKHQSVPTQPAPPSPDQSPDPEAPGSHTTSFESNTEPLLEETRFPPHLLQLPSYETRRQNYRNILNWRLRKMEARNARRHGTVGRQTSLEDTSFDSMDTVDTEESSTDASRLDQATTSFESTTDNTDSPGEQQVHRLQQLRADSGYRSLENPVPNSLKLLYPQQHVISSDGDPPHRIPSLGESFEDVSEAEEAILDDIDIEGCPIQRHSCAESELDEGVAGLRSPPYSLYESTSWDGRRKPGGQPTSKKRRDLGGSAEYTRDYSVDEKSDALFREFSRCEVDSKRHHRLTAYRRLRGPYPYPKLNEPQADCVLGFSLIDDEVTLASVPIIRVAPDEDSSDHV